MAIGKRFRFPTFGVFSLCVTLLALLLTAVGLWIVLQAEKSEVAAQVLANDELTMYPSMPGLESQFTYDGEEVAHLWKVRVKFLNSGQKTIVGSGNQTTILGEGLNFAFPDDTRILKIEEEVNKFQSTVVQLRENNFQVQFSQWRSREYMTASFYVESDRPLEIAPRPSVPTRDIVDGDVVIQDLTQERGERTFLIDRFPSAISTPGKIIGVIFAGIFLIILVIIVVGDGTSLIKFALWKRQHLFNFTGYLTKMKPPLSNKAIRMYIEAPNLLPKKHWAKFKGKKAPAIPIVLESQKGVIFFTILTLVAGFGFISLILMLIPV